MPLLWSNPNLKWEGFKPQAYVLDTEKLWTLALEDVSKGENTTIGAIIYAFRDEKVEIEDRTTQVEVRSCTQKIIVRGPSFHRDLLRFMYRFAEDDLSPYEIRWFYFDSDNCTQDAQTLYSFFLVARNKIIDEHFSLSDYTASGFDPSVLTGTVAEKPLWFDEPHWAEAYDRLWYRKFYTETTTGQLMVLRPDEPQLYFYPEGRYRSIGGIEGWLSEIYKLTRGVRIAVWILIAMSLLEVYLHWR